MEKLEVDGNFFDAYQIATVKVSILMIKGSRGMLACGYISRDAADKFGDALATVSGVNSYADMLEKSVVGVSKAAGELGVKVGMSGREALKRFA